MATLYLIGHGAHDLLGRAMAGRIPGVHLNAEGKRQAERLAERLGEGSLRAIYSSPLERAQETAAPLAARLGLPVQTSEAGGLEAQARIEISPGSVSIVALSDYGPQVVRVNDTGDLLVK
jgi:broad specificity phosphatase PhoE